MTNKIVMENGNTIQGIKSCVYTETVNAGNGLRPGCVAASYIDVEVFGSQSAAPYSGEPLTYYQVDSEGVETLIGTYYAEPSISSKNTYSFKAYDAVSKLDASFSERLQAIQSNFPMTVYQIVSEACAWAGVNLGSASWPLSTQPVEAFYADGLTCRNILQYAAEIAGRFVRCNSSGNVVFDWYTVNSTYNIRPGVGQSGDIAYKQDGLTYDAYTVRTLEAVAIKPSGTEGAAYIYPTSVGGITATDDGEGNILLTNIAVTDNNGHLYLNAEAEDELNTGDVSVSDTAGIANTLVIGENLLLTNTTEAIYLAAAQNVYDVMSVLPNYRHATVQLFSFENPFRAGEIVSVTDAQGVSFVTPIFTMTTQQSSAVIASSGGESYDNDTGSDTQKTLANLSANIVQIDRLKVGYAEADQVVTDILEATDVTAENLKVNAANITGSLTVTDANDNVIFEADTTNNTVQFGGSTASNGTINGGIIRGAQIISEATGFSGDTLHIEISGGNLKLENYVDIYDATYKANLGGEAFADRLQFRDDEDGTESYTSHYASREAHIEGDLTVAGNVTIDGFLSAPCATVTVDADTLFTPGLYYMASGSTNLPEGTNGVLWVIEISELYYKQVFQRFGTPGTNDNNIYTRTYGASGWGSWWRFSGTAV